MKQEYNNQNFKRILVGVDDSEDAQLAFRYAIHEARENKATLIIASVLEHDEMNIYQALDKDYIHGEREALMNHIEKYRQLALRAGVEKVDTIISEGEAGETIVKEIIPAVDPDLLIIGSMSKQGIKKYFGSQAAYMAKYSPISVMVVR
ncbi:universal stress protein [Lentilactobacillus kribbianus]|uniref:universal stress protein n=1 Tax=Lentilactobacillus kribbianus TaxID=2729622 RepID=UPI0015547E5F|nr:universal stress protein [Lentilactobacillus kribbianus]